MSHATGAVRFTADNRVMYYEYNGTSDVTISHLYETRQEVLDNWRNHTWLHCTCGKDEPAEIYTSYGFGFSWMGRACRHCYAITDGFNPGDEVFDGDIDNTEPDWLKVQS